MTEVCLESYH